MMIDSNWWQLTVIYGDWWCLYNDNDDILDGISYDDDADDDSDDNDHDDDIGDDDDDSSAALQTTTTLPLGTS